MLKKRAKTPVILQMEAAECGAAALGIILAYFKRYLSLEELRIACGVSRDGSKAVNMLKAARRYGLKAEGASIEMDAFSELSFPLIAFLEFNHFVVVEGFDNKKFYLNDPATGPRTVTYEEFSRAFTGIILLFKLTPAFQAGGKRESLGQELRRRFIGVRKDFFFITLTSLFLVIPGVALAAFSKIFIDEVLIHQLSSWLLPFIWGMLITVGLRSLLTWVQQIHLTRLQLKITVVTSAQFFLHVLRLPMSFFSQRFLGDISSRIAANDRIATVISGDLSTSLVSMISMVFYALVMVLYDGVLTSIGVFIACINAFLLIFLSKKIENSSRCLLQEQGQLFGMELGGLQAIETIKSIGREEDYFQGWAGYHAKTLNNQHKIQLYNRILSIAPLLLNGIMGALILGVGSLRIMYGYLTIGALIGFQILLASFSEPLNVLLGFGSKLQVIRGDITRLNDVLRHPEEIRIGDKIERPVSLQEVEKLAGNLELKNISFGYSQLEPPLLKEICFSLKQGKSLALVGMSGSGKSTLAKMICGLYTPWEGDILFDEYAFQEIPRAILRQTLSFVDQDVFLFEGTIRDNLTLWDKNIRPEILEQAIADAELSTLLASREEGLASQISTQGANLSGGQRQQLEIARALAIQPNLLILDEATASLDAITEANIVANLRKRGCTLLMIAHRLSTVRSCDEIILLEQGRILARGTHESLQKKSLVYQKLLLEWSHGEG